MVSSRHKVREDVHFRILRLLQASSEWSQREIADNLGISNGGVHYALGALVSRGLIKLGNFTSSEDRRRYAYVLTPKGATEKAVLARRLLDRKMKEFDALKSEIDTLRDELEQV